MILKKSGLLLVSLTIAFVVFFFSLTFFIEEESRDKDYYDEMFRIHRIPAVTGKTMGELSAIGDRIRLYLRTGNEKLLVRNFNHREILHMEDVYRLFQWNRRILRGTALLCPLLILLFWRWKNLRKYLWKGGLLLLSLFGIFGFLVSRDFSKAFLLFHNLFFTNDLWLMDPSRDLMIQMLPEDFFRRMALEIGIKTLILFGFYCIGTFLWSEIYGKSDGRRKL